MHVTILEGISKVCFSVQLNITLAYAQQFRMIQANNIPTTYQAFSFWKKTVKDSKVFMTLALFYFSFIAQMYRAVGRL